MEDVIEKKPRRTRSDKGQPRQRKAVAPPAILPAPEPEAPIHVRLRLKNYPEPVEFGCAEHTVENGFHVFLYPSERDRYRTTRREFAISEIIEVEITAARQIAEYAQLPSQYDFSLHRLNPETGETVPVPQRGPQIHRAPRASGTALERLATSSGPIKMDAVPRLSFGDEAPPGLLTGKAD